MSLSLGPSSIGSSGHNSGGGRGNNKTLFSSSFQESDVFSRLRDCPSVDDVWPDLESYLVQAAHTIRTGSVEMMERLRDVKHRMNWYAVIYSVCSSHPQKSNEMYQHLSLFLVNDLEVNVLRPFLRHGPISGSSSSSSLCQQFVEQYRLFMAFRRVVLSCFSYLDQYFTAKFRLDPVTALCVKLFYAVVYEPIKEVLVTEMLELANAARTAHLNGGRVSSAGSDVQQTLLAIVEILSTVKAFSSSPDTTAQSTRPHDKKDAMGACSYTQKRGNEGSSMLAAVSAELERKHGSTTVAPKCEMPRMRSVSPWRRNSSNSVHSRVEERAASEGRGSSSSPLRMWDATAARSLHAVRMLREMLEKRSLADLMAGRFMTNKSGKKSFHGGGTGTGTGTSNIKNSNNNTNNIVGTATAAAGAGGGVGSATTNTVDSEGVFIVDVVQPLHYLIFADFGVKYVEAAEAYYRKQRVLQLSLPEGWMNYIPWVQRCLGIERELLRDVNAPLFLSALRERIHHVLLVEVHRLIILAKEVGFRAQLDAWDSVTGRSTANMLEDVVTSSSLTGVTVSEGCGDVTAAPAACSSTHRTNPWERLSQEELGHRIRYFVTTFVSTQDEACWTLLASEFANKVIMDAAALFLTYMSQVEALTQQQHQHKEEQSPRGHRHTALPQTQPHKTIVPLRRRHFGKAEAAASDMEPVSQQSLAMGLIRDLVETSMHYSELIHDKFNEHPPMRLAMSDALREILNPDRWGQPVVGGAMHGGGVSAFSRVESSPSVLLNHDVAMRTIGVLNKLTAMRGTKGIALPQFLAMYCDHFCRRDLDDTVADTTDHIVYLITLLDDKDVFFEHYKSLLARRLLLLPSAQLNMDREQALVHKLHHTLGRTLTYSLQAMLRDHESNASLNEAFGRSVDSLELSTKLRVYVLTAVHWPTYRVASLVPCNSLAVAMKAFTDYYIGVHPSRMLHWIHTLGNATLHAVFPKGSKELIANILQAHILLLVSDAFNTDSGVETAVNNAADESETPVTHSLSGREIAAAMGLEFSDIYIYLAPLVLHKLYNLLVRVSPSAVADTEKTNPSSSLSSSLHTVETEGAASTAARARLVPEDKFTLNFDYTHRLRKFKLPVARPMRGDELKGAAFDPTYAEKRDVSVSNAIEVSRRLQMDAAIVRIMKSRRALRYYELLDLTVQQLSKHFVPRARSVKTQVEDLVCRGFLRRSEADPSVFEYVA